MMFRSYYEGWHTIRSIAPMTAVSNLTVAERNQRQPRRPWYQPLHRCHKSILRSDCSFFASSFSEVRASCFIGYVFLSVIGTSAS